MQLVRQIRQLLVEIRKTVDKGGKVSRDQKETLEMLTDHEYYAIRRQAAGVLVKVSKDYKYRLWSGKINLVIRPLINPVIRPHAA